MDVLDFRDLKKAIPESGSPTHTQIPEMGQNQTGMRLK